MHINITNYRGCERAAVKGGPIVIVGARNHNGKTSLLEGVALAVTEWVVPPGLPKRDIGMLLFTNDKGMRAAKGMVSVALDSGTKHVTYPKGEVQQEGELKVSPVAAGLVKLPELTPDQLAKALAPIVQSEPTLEDLLKAFAEHKLDAKTAGAVWKKVQDEGWDKALKQAQERGALIKSEWQTITGQRWGTAIGESWRPPGWDDALLADETTDEDIAALKLALDEAHKAASFSDGVMATLQEDVAALETRKTEASKAQEAAQAALAELLKAEAHRAGLQNPDEGGLEMPCPECGVFLMLLRKDGATVELTKADPHKTGAAALAKMRKDIAAADGDLANKRTAYTNANASMLAAQAALQRSRDAVVKFNEAAAATGDGGNVEEAQASYDAARDRVARRSAHALAQSKHATILGNSAIQEILAPAGVRAKALKRGLATFNSDHLMPLCDAAGFPALVVRDDLTIEWEGKPWGWQFYSGAERWLGNAVLQIAVARADGSQMVILDGADICDAGNRNKLFKVLAQIGIEALVGMTYNKPEQLPDLAAMELGARFWIKQGVTEAIAA